MLCGFWNGDGLVDDVGRTNGGGGVLFFFVTAFTFNYWSCGGVNRGHGDVLTSDSGDNSGSVSECHCFIFFFSFFFYISGSGGRVWLRGSCDGGNSLYATSAVRATETWKDTLIGSWLHDWESGGSTKDADGRAGWRYGVGGVIRVQLWSGDGIVGDLWVVDVDQDTWIGRRIGSWEFDGLRSVLAGGARDFNVGARWVELSSLCVFGSMKGDNFVTHEILTVLDLAGEGDGPSIVILDESFGCPSSISHETGFVNLEPVQLRSNSCCAVTTAVGEVSDDGTLVGVWPFGPEESDLAAS
ncbi:hypothetical protein AA313_de0206668 [Arthrobotrys entomopaga]|nr:hypothetical protein AA313_de0206668 [Arthrobotrys entomopaga]